MGDDADRFRELVTAIADGRPIDWAQLEAAATSDADRQILEKMRLIAAVEAAHRQDVAFDNVNRESPAEDPSNRNLRISTSDNRRRVRRTPTRWGKLQVHERVGEGAFGEVYRAFDLDLEREVALKLFWPGSRSPDELRGRVLQEVRSLASIKHLNVAAVYGIESFDGRLGMWMEFVRGVTLAQLIQEQGRFSACEAVLIGLQLCDALTAVHAAGYLHRDVKVHNVMREEGGRIVLMDFGAAQTMNKATQSIGGTPLYIAPEVLDGKAASVGSDIYSLGVLLFRLVTDTYPCHGASIDEVRLSHSQKIYIRAMDVRPDLPVAFVDTLEKALCPDPNDRFPTAEALRLDLKRALDSSLLPPIRFGRQRLTSRYREKDTDAST